MGRPFYLTDFTIVLDGVILRRARYPLIPQI